METLGHLKEFICSITLEKWKDVFNILFFIVIACISTLTYLQAKKTLFAPIRTETFKLQLKAFEEVLLYFQNKSEFDFIKSFDLNRIVALNTMKMVDAYARTFFPNSVKINTEKQKEAYSKLVGGIASNEYMNNNISTVKTHDAFNVDFIESKQTNSNDNPLKNWATYEHGLIEYTQEFRDQLNELQKLAASPLLPNSLREMIAEFSGIARKNLILSGEIIDNLAQQMPLQFPEPTDIKKFNPSGAWNEFNDTRIIFKPQSQKILDSINTYLQIEDLMHGGRKK